MKRQIRFTKFELIFVNKSSATIMENSLRDYNQQQGIYFRIIMHDSITQLNVSNNQYSRLSIIRISGDLAENLLYKG